MKRLIGVALLALAACADTSIPLSETVNAGIKSRADNQFNPRTTIIRSFRTNEKGKRVQVGGAVCSGSNARISFSNVVTPGRVSIPSYLQADRFTDRGQPPAIALRCELEGKTVRQTWEPSAQVKDGSSDSTTCIKGNCTSVRTIKLTSKLSSTLPWFYPNEDVDF